jgi:hypothetical protein
VKVFLSYRREDTGGRAGRLFDVLVSRFGVRNVFQDVSAVAPGLDFTAQVEAAIESCDAVLVVIGPNWLGDVDHDGGRRIDRPDDFVRQEVSKALAKDIPVVPVLVEGASLPLAEDLPDDMASLVLRQAVTLSDVSWHPDVNDLIRRLEGGQPLTARRRLWPIVVAAGVVVVVVVAVVALVIRRNGDGTSSDQTGDGSSANTSPISLPAGLSYVPTPHDTKVCRPGGQLQLSAGPIELDGNIMTTSFTASALRLQTETGFNAVRVVDAQGRPYDGVDGGGGFSLDQDGAGETEHSAQLSMNRDEGAHPGTAGIVLVVTGECIDDPIYLPVSVPGG